MLLDGKYVAERKKLGEGENIGSSFDFKLIDIKDIILEVPDRKRASDFFYKFSINKRIYL